MVDINDHHTRWSEDIRRYHEGLWRSPAKLFQAGSASMSQLHALPAYTSQLPVAAVAGNSSCDQGRQPLPFPQTEKRSQWFNRIILHHCIIYLTRLATVSFSWLLGISVEKKLVFKSKCERCQFHIRIPEKAGCVCVCVCLCMECCSCKKKKISEVTTWFVPGPTWLKKGLAECTYNVKIHQVTHILLQEKSWKQSKKTMFPGSNTWSNTGAFFWRQVQWARFQIRMQNPTEPPEADGDDGGWWMLMVPFRVFGRM